MNQQAPKWMSKSHLISLISPFDMDFELISATAQLHCSAELCFCWTFRVKCKKLDISVSCHFYFDFLFLPFICPSCPLLSCECHSCLFFFYSLCVKPVCLALSRLYSHLTSSSQVLIDLCCVNIAVVAIGSVWIVNLQLESVVDTTVRSKQEGLL